MSKHAPPRVEVRVNNHNYNSYSDDDFNRDVQNEMRKMEEEMRNSKLSSQYNDQLRDNNYENDKKERIERREIEERNEKHRLKKQQYKNEIDDRTNVKAASQIQLRMQLEKQIEEQKLMKQHEYEERVQINNRQHQQPRYSSERQQQLLLPAQHDQPHVQNNQRNENYSNSKQQDNNDATTTNNNNNNIGINSIKGNDNSLSWKPSGNQKDENQKRLILSQKQALEEQIKEKKKQKEEEKKKIREQDMEDERRVRAELLQENEINITKLNINKISNNNNSSSPGKVQNSPRTTRNKSNPVDNMSKLISPSIHNSPLKLNSPIRSKSKPTDHMSDLLSPISNKVENSPRGGKKQYYDEDNYPEKNLKDSPGKNLSPARQRLFNDVFSNQNMIVHDNIQGFDEWKPTGNVKDEKKRQKMLEQQEALRLQVIDLKKRKDEEKRKIEYEDLLDEQEFAKARLELRVNKITNSNIIKKVDIFAESSHESPNKEKKNDNIPPVLVKLKSPPKIKFSQNKQINLIDDNQSNNNNNNDGLNDDFDRLNSNLKEIPTKNKDKYHSDLNSSDSVDSINFDSSYNNINLPSLPSNFGPSLGRPSSTDELESFLINWQRQIRENTKSPRGDLNINNYRSNNNNDFFFKSPSSSSEKNYHFKNNNFNNDISQQFQKQYQEQKFVYYNYSNNSSNNNQFNHGNMPNQNHLEQYPIPANTSIIDTNSRFLLQSDANTDLTIALGQNSRFEASLKSESTLVIFEDKPPSANE